MPGASGRDAHAVGGVRVDAASGQDPPDRVRPLRGGPTRAARVGKPETFHFLGLPTSAGRSRQGGFLLKRKSRRDRMRATLRAVKEALRRRMHQPIPVQGRWLKQVVTGYFAYHGVPTNGRAWGRPLPRHGPMAAHAAASQPEGRSPWTRSQRSPLTGFPLRASFIPGRSSALPSHTQGGSRVPNRARSDLCGGRSVMGVPTAIIVLVYHGMVALAPTAPSRR